MGKSVSAPPAPDYVGAAQQTSAGDLKNLQYQTQANRPNVVTPWGTQTWSPTAADGSSTQTIALSPDQQASLDAQQKVQTNQSQLAQNLQGQVQDTMSGGFNAPQLSSYMNGVPSVRTDFSGFSPNGVNGVMQNFGPGPRVNTNSGQFTAGAGPVNLNAPQFTDANRQQSIDSAYKASTGLLQDQWNQQNTHLDNQLRLQGLTPGTEAYNNAMQNQLRVQGQQQDQLANQAVLTGDQTANTDYASALSGYGAGLGAQGQAYGQGLQSFGANNSAIGQQFGQNQSAFNTANAGQNQAFNQGLATYGTGIAANQAYNQAQQQSQSQALQNYGTTYQAALQNYLQPLNSMNAVLTGQQVQSPTFPGFTNAGYTPGTNYSGAASALGQWNSGLAAQQNAANSSFNGLLGTGLMAGATYFSDARLKANIKQIGTTTGGHNWYEWDWKDGSGSSTGVIAQEAAFKAPGAIYINQDGHLLVDYAQIH